VTKDVNTHGTDGGCVTVGLPRDDIPLPDCASYLARLRPGHPAGQYISNLIGQLGNYERNPLLLKPKILMSCQRIEEARR
jgi:hypothetical protein